MYDAFLGLRLVSASHLIVGVLDCIFIINIGKKWEKLMMAARVIVAIENPQDIIPLAGRHTLGTFTNQMQKSFTEPRLLILTDPRTDHHPIKEASLGNIPTIAFCDTDSPMPYVHIGIPSNNKGKNNIGCLFWMLARMVLQIRDTILPGHKWDVMVDLFFYRKPEETKDQEDDESGAPVTEHGGVMIFNDNWGVDTQWARDAVAAPALAGGAEWATDAGVPVEGGEVSLEPDTPVKYW
ncbi:hypothetical protein MKX03_000471 [Papaver bracteatum]|nr:hypothetical protein MKX03_000471 [Papaver bracteatum]